MAQTSYTHQKVRVHTCKKDTTNIQRVKTFSFQHPDELDYYTATRPRICVLGRARVLRNDIIINDPATRRLPRSSNSFSVDQTSPFEAAGLQKIRPGFVTQAQD